MIVIALSAIATFLLTRSPAPPQRALVLGASTAIITLTNGLLIDWTSATAIALTLLIFLGVYTGFCQSSYADFRYFLPNLATSARKILASTAALIRTLARLAIGTRTWNHLHNTQPPNSSP
ncbi:hypothetical protein [Actinokineospora sp. NBRC 105648]|uniref:hypothetical protein n=1 Tax=Actinokineospora sp. NBRC 105648 TaxID=3032206 RepID=UPI0024A59C3A|nr:hypothetical protein [Actinokineospora sp. NBRC 105648]GLZ42825.1 hypothetical protein Acsp05_64490 [Actinokineospora sp. NBRC 105648]